MILKNQNSVFGPFRYNNILLFFALLLIILINKVVSTNPELTNCDCEDNNVYDIDGNRKTDYANSYCLISGNKLGSFKSFQTTAECTDANNFPEEQFNGITAGDCLFF